MNLKVGQKIYCIKSERVYNNDDKRLVIRKDCSYIIENVENGIFYIYSDNVYLGYEFDEFDIYFITINELRLKKLNIV